VDADVIGGPSVAAPMGGEIAYEHGFAPDALGLIAI
jgi:hypothetical protein